MNNRDKLLNTNIYDLLVSMNKQIIERSYYETCVLGILEKEDIECEYFTCEECIQNYLNKEV